MSNLIQTKNFLAQENVRGKFAELLGKKSQGFLTSVLQVVSNNNLLQNADAQSVYGAAMMAATLDLPINNNLGFAYIVPYKGQASFQMGYKGFIQLAQRSGQFKTINAVPIYQGQLIKNDPFSGLEFDFGIEPQGDPIGYCAYFKLLNGYEQWLYMTKNQVQAHANKYSQTAKKGFGVWKDNFDEMALKTVIKRILSKFAPLSIEMQKAVESDQAVAKVDENLEVQFEYVDNEKSVEQKLPELTPDHPSFEAIKAQIISGEKSLDDVEKKFTLTQEAFDALMLDQDLGVKGE